MKIIAAFFRLIRWPNLVFIALTQLLFEYCIVRQVYEGNHIQPGETHQFLFLLIASVLIAGGGYIINDYFDLNIDQVNKPDKVVVNVIINRRWVIFWHMFLSLLGFFFTFYAFPIAGYWHLVLANLASILLLWFYSTNLKKQFLIGNLIISVLTAWTIGIIFLSKYPLSFGNIFSLNRADIRFFRLTIVYVTFAFVISLIREIVKDLEDMDGDRKYGCRTMPIVWGINTTKVFVAVWIIVLVAALTVLQLYVLPFGWWHSALYSLLLIILPLVWVLRKLYTAQTASDFHQLSSVIKWVMLSGIVSMIFFRLYF